jgi:hypothetical protein
VVLLRRFHLQYGKGFTLVDPDIARTVLCIFWMLAEPVRLAAGWYGNLQENVSRGQQECHICYIARGSSKTDVQVQA